MNLAPPTSTASTAWSPARVRWSILAVSMLAGLLATFGGPQPTGNPTVDAVLVACSVAGITWLGAAALRWDAAVITLLAGLASLSIVGTVVGVAAAVIGFVVPVRAGRRSLLNAVLIGIALNIAARSQLEMFLGASTLVALALAGYVGAVGFTRRSGTSRRAVATTLAIAGSVAFLATCSLALFGYLAADDLREGNRLTEVGLEALGDGDLATARSTFASAAEAFEAADDRIDTPLTAAARYVPILAQHHRVVTELTSEAAETARVLDTELRRVDLDALSVTDGRIDVDQVRALQSPLRTIELRIEELQATIGDLDSAWLAPSVAKRVGDLADDVARQRQRSHDALAVAMAAPGLLGADEPRTYFVGFTTPSEARGSGGFMGNWAELSITDGQIAMTRFGRADDLNEAGDPTTRRFPTTGDDTSDGAGSDVGFDRWLSRYGPYNLASGPDGTTGTEPWKNINMSPDTAMTGRAIASLYPQSGGGQLDGVFILDVYTLARLLEFTGPIALPEGHLVDGQPFVTADNAAKFLLHDQYEVTKVDTRADVLEAFSQAVVDTLLGGTLPPPTELLDVLGPMVDQGRFTGWAVRPEEQAILDQIGMSGTLAVPEDDDALAIVFNNAVGNKIDYYLGSSATYRVTADQSTGTAHGQLELTMTNGAPEIGEPGYVIGNPIGLPVGVNRTWVSIFTRLPVQQVHRDGEPIDTAPGAEAGYFVTSTYVELAAGATTTLRFDMVGPLDLVERYTLAARTPPTVAPTPLEIDATWVDAGGTEHRSTTEVLAPGTTRVVVDGSTGTMSVESTNTAAPD